MDFSSGNSVILFLFVRNRNWIFLVLQGIEWGRVNDMATPMQRTLSDLRKYNIPYWVVENYNHFTKKRTDLFNIFDVLALDNGFVGVQVCGVDIGPHKEKILVDHVENTTIWLKNGGRVEVWAWRKLKKLKKNGKKGKQTIWVARIFDVLLVNNELYWEERG